METKLRALLDQTKAFHRVAVEHVDGLRPIEDLRAQIAFQAGCLTVEHSLGIWTLITSERHCSAFALLRPQLESLVRGIWLLHGASESWIGKFTQPLQPASAKHANEGLGFAEMLRELESSPHAPDHIVSQLREYKTIAWKPLNSFTHGGIHPLARISGGFPPQLTYEAVRNANAVLALALQLLSILTGDTRNMAPVARMHEEFSGCFNMLPAFTQQ